MPGSIVLLTKSPCLKSGISYNKIKIGRKLFSTDITTPRSLFDVYAKNPHWLGVYERHPVVKNKLGKKEFLEIQKKEEAKLAPINLPEFIDPKFAQWNPESSKRVGALGTKIDVTTLFTKDGKGHVVTVVEIKDCHVIDTQISREDGGTDPLTQLIVGAQEASDESYISQMSREKIEWWDNLGLFPKKFWGAFQVTKDALLLPGTPITASHFVAGQFVRVQGKTIKRGFQGVMKRWGMKGQPASHGQSKTHRKMGATGGGQDPGRIFPGKRMAGHVGGKFSTTNPLQILRINTKYNLLFIQGKLPGERGDYLKIYDNNIKNIPSKKATKKAPYFPTHIEDFHGPLEEELYAENTFGFNEPSIEFPPFKA